MDRICCIKPIFERGIAISIRLEKKNDKNYANPEIGRKDAGRNAFQYSTHNISVLRSATALQYNLSLTDNVHKVFT